MRSYKAAVRRAAEVGEPFQVEYVDRKGVAQVETFTAYGEPGSLTLSQFAAVVDADESTIKPEHVALISELLSEMFDNDVEYRRFTVFVRQHRIDDETVLDIIQGLIEDLSGRPTGRSSSSSAGPSTTGPTSKAVSLSPAPPADKTQDAPTATPLELVVVEGVDELDRAYSA